MQVNPSVPVYLAPWRMVEGGGGGGAIFWDILPLTLVIFIPMGQHISAGFGEGEGGINKDWFNIAWLATAFNSFWYAYHFSFIHWQGWVQAVPAELSCLPPHCLVKYFFLLIPGAWIFHWWTFIAWVATVINSFGCAYHFSFFHWLDWGQAVPAGISCPPHPPIAWSRFFLLIPDAFIYHWWTIIAWLQQWLTNLDVHITSLSFIDGVGGKLSQLANDKDSHDQSINLLSSDLKHLSQNFQKYNGSFG